jgi:hypothetical protein
LGRRSPKKKLIEFAEADTQGGTPNEKTDPLSVLLTVEQQKPGVPGGEEENDEPYRASQSNYPYYEYRT